MKLIYVFRARRSITVLSLYKLEVICEEQWMRKSFGAKKTKLPKGSTDLAVYREFGTCHSCSSSLHEIKRNCELTFNSQFKKLILMCVCCRGCIYLLLHK